MARFRAAPLQDIFFLSSGNLNEVMKFIQHTISELLVNIYSFADPINPWVEDYMTP